MCDDEVVVSGGIPFEVVLGLAYWYSMANVTNDRGKLNESDELDVGLEMNKDG